MKYQIFKSSGNFEAELRHTAIIRVSLANWRLGNYGRIKHQNNAAQRLPPLCTRRTATCTSKPIKNLIRVAMVKEAAVGQILMSIGYQVTESKHGLIQRLMLYR